LAKSKVQGRAARKTYFVYNNCARGNRLTAAAIGRNALRASDPVARDWHVPPPSHRERPTVTAAVTSPATAALVMRRRWCNNRFVIKPTAHDDYFARTHQYTASPRAVWEVGTLNARATLATRKWLSATCAPTRRRSLARASWRRRANTNMWWYWNESNVFIELLPPHFCTCHWRFSVFFTVSSHRDNFRIALELWQQVAPRGRRPISPPLWHCSVFCTYLIFIIICVQTDFFIIFLLILKLAAFSIFHINSSVGNLIFYFY